MAKIRVNNEQDLAKVYLSLTEIAPLLKEKSYDVEIKEHKEKRSLNANAYSWLLQDKIAKALNRKIDDIHEEMILQYGVMENLSMLKDAFESAKRLFDYYKILGESELNGKQWVHIRVGIGTHHYNSSEMAKFIEGVVADAKDLGIETKTPSEIAELKSLWEQEKYIRSEFNGDLESY